jgi:hypothetical protein
MRRKNGITATLSGSVEIGPANKPQKSGAADFQLVNGDGIFAHRGRPPPEGYAALARGLSGDVDAGT